MEELLRLVIEDIKAHPENFNMNFWVKRTSSDIEFPSAENPHPCGTACCIAGRIAVITGATIEVPVDSGIIGNRAWFVIDSDGERYSIEEYAAEKLGFSNHECDRLFNITGWPDAYYDMAFDDGEAKAAIELLESVIEKGYIWW